MGNYLALLSIYFLLGKSEKVVGGAPLRDVFCAIMLLDEQDNQQNFLPFSYFLE